jgi:hypothetical protein
MKLPRDLSGAPFFLVVFTCLSLCPDLLAASTPADRSYSRRLPRQDQNAIKTSWPGIGCWFWGAAEFKPDGYKPFLDLHSEGSRFQLLTTSIRHPVEVTEPRVHDQIKAAAEYARSKGMKMVMDLDVRLARSAFQREHPREMQELVRLRETPLAGQGDVTLFVEPINLGDHYTFQARGYDSLSARVLRVYSYAVGPGGLRPDTVRDITSRCAVPQADAKGVQMVISCRPEDAGRTACVLAAFTLFTPDLFAPHLIPFERSVLKQYRDVPLAGACKDEWGFPGRFQPRTDDLFYSSAMAATYARRRPGHDLARDLLLMAKAEEGRVTDRSVAIHHYMEMNWQRNAEVESAFYEATKETFGKAAMVGTHPTWYPFPSAEEVFKNGLHWWAARRDLAQTDEATPFCVRTALSKKWQSPLWYNMYYSDSLKTYEEDLWRHALGGGRMNFHPLWPHPFEKLSTSLLEGELLAADSRVRLLNYVSAAPLDCPVAIVFGHPSALNWSGSGLADVGLGMANALWKEGYYADVIPSSEVQGGSLRVSADGRLQYGSQQYRAAVLFHPEGERLGVSRLFQKLVRRGRTATFQVGEWTLDFEGKPIGASAGSPFTARHLEPQDVVQEILALLRVEGVEPQTRCTLRGVAGFSESMMPLPVGRCHLVDGTVILASGAKAVQGDPIRETLSVNGYRVFFDAVGVAALRMNKRGEVEAMAAGGLKSFQAGTFSLDLPERVDVALWREGRGGWHGVIQGRAGPIPEPLLATTRDWVKLSLPSRGKP